MVRDGLRLFAFDADVFLPIIIGGLMAIPAYMFLFDKDEFYSFNV